MAFSIDTSELEAGLNFILQNTNREFAKAVEFTAEAITAKAQTIAPKRFGDLQGSSFVDDGKVTSRGVSVEFGFSAKHASVMDTGFKTPVIRPVRAKALFIPLTRRAARAGAGGPAGAVGLVPGVDFIFRKSVRTPKTRKGAGKGPNRFFTDSVEDKTFVESILGKSADAAFKRLEK